MKIAVITCSNRSAAGVRPDESGHAAAELLTDAGHAHVIAAAPGHIERVRDLVIDALTPQALLALKDASNTITGRIDHAG